MMRLKGVVIVAYFAVYSFVPNNLLNFGYIVELRIYSSLVFSFNFLSENDPVKYIVTFIMHTTQSKLSLPRSLVQSSRKEVCLKDMRTCFENS